MFNRRFTTGAALTALILLAPLAPAAIAADTVNTISLATWGSSPAETAALTDAIATFETRYPAIKVNLIVDTDHSAQMAAKFASHTPPDVFYVDWGVAQDWIGQGVLYDLTSSIAGSNFSLAPFNKSYLKPFQSAGGIYGLPQGCQSIGIRRQQDVDG